MLNIVVLNDGMRTVSRNSVSLQKILEYHFVVSREKENVSRSDDRCDFYVVSMHEARNS